MRMSTADEERSWSKPAPVNLTILLNYYGRSMARSDAACQCPVPDVDSAACRRPQIPRFVISCECVPWSAMRTSPNSRKRAQRRSSTIEGAASYTSALAVSRRPAIAQHSLAQEVDQIRPVKNRSKQAGRKSHIGSALLCVSFKRMISVTIHHHDTIEGGELGDDRGVDLSLSRDNSGSH